MDFTTVTTLFEGNKFPIAVGAFMLWWIYTSTEKREARMMDIIEGFRSVLGKFNETLIDVSTSLRDVKGDISDLKNDVNDLKKNENKQ